MAFNRPITKAQLEDALAGVEAGVSPKVDEKLPSTPFGRLLLASTSAAAVKTALGLPSASLATLDNGGKVPPEQLPNTDALVEGAANLWFTPTRAQNAVSKTTIGLSNVDNTSDLAKPISTATQAALNNKAALSSPAFTGVPTAPTAALGTNTTQLATMAAIRNAIDAITGGAPGTLDAFNEFANAIGNDPNFNTTMATALAGKLAETRLGAASGAAATDANNKLLETHLPDRLKPKQQALLADFDTAIDNGWYRTSPTSLNRPIDEHGMLFVQSHGDAGWVIQTWTAFTSNNAADTKTFRREQDAGGWTAWYRLRLSEDELNTLYKPDRLSAYTANWQTDANTLLENGFYKVLAGSANVPEDTYGLIIVQNDGTAPYITQTWVSHALANASDTHMWRRHRNAGVWQAWYRLRSSEAELNALYRDYSRPGIANPAIVTYQTLGSRRLDLRDWDGIDLTGNNDCTSKFQAFANESGTAKQAGHYPAGEVALGSTITLPGGAVIVGSGYLAQRGVGVNAQRNARSSILKFAHNGKGIHALEPDGPGGLFNFCTYRSTQNAVSGGSFTPAALDWDILIEGATDWRYDNIGFLNATKGIKWDCGPSLALGRQFVGNLTGQCFDVMVEYEHALDCMFFLGAIHQWPYDGNEAEELAYMYANSRLIRAGRADNPFVNVVHGFANRYAVEFFQSAAKGTSPGGITSKMHMRKLYCDYSQTGLYVNNAPGVSADILSLDVVGRATNPLTNPRLFDIQNSAGSRLCIGMAQADYILGPMGNFGGSSANCWVDIGPMKALNSGGNTYSGAAFTGPSSNNVWLSAQAQMFANTMNGGWKSGGVAVYAPTFSAL